MKTKIKICCIQNVDEAKLAITFGASALGLVSKMPSGPGVISEEKILEIAKSTPPTIATFLLTSLTNAEEIISQHNRCRTNTIQFVDAIPFGEYKKIRDALPGISLVQVIHVRDETAIDEAKEVQHYIDAILLDSGNPNLHVKELGGTGRTHNWNISRKLRTSVNVPIFLAGGLSPENIREAIETVLPFGVDICSGVRTNGILDEVKLEKFVAAVNADL
ncbi:MAG: phosphoribosylanthranilate isomerase [Ignavibacteriales bacterium]|nr:phosphoribosylanthranilate isomerase [Ignavibacteriales bacterium]